MCIWLSIKIQVDKNRKEENERKEGREIILAGFRKSVHVKGARSIYMEVITRPRTNLHANKGRQRESADAPLSRDSEHGRSRTHIYIVARRRHLCVRCYQYDANLDRYAQPSALFSVIFHDGSSFLASYVTQSRVIFQNFPEIASRHVSRASRRISVR